MLKNINFYFTRRFHLKRLFYLQVADGVSSLLIGSVGSYIDPLVVCGGGCSLQGFDSEGNDPFWTVTGDNVTSLALMDFDSDGKNEVSHKFI